VDFAHMRDEAFRLHIAAASVDEIKRALHERLESNAHCKSPYC
jgi:hypothetical protein